jgi:hypothetical protein
MSNEQPAPLWSDEDIANDAKRASSNPTTQATIRSCLFFMRFGYEAALERLTQANDELRDALDFAAQYRGNEGRSRPLCKYRNGVFIEACQMHKDMDELMREVNRLRKQLGIAPAYPFIDEEMVLINEEIARQWRPIDFIELSDGLEVHVDTIAMTIGRGDTALATHAWPENGYEYVICRRPNNQKEPGGNNE